MCNDPARATLALSHQADAASTPVRMTRTRQKNISLISTRARVVLPQSQSTLVALLMGSP